jgi:hypothetical protein
VNKHDSVKSGEHEIGTAGKRAIVEAVPKASGVESGAQHRFDASVLLSDARHDLGSGLLVDRIHIKPSQ